MAVWLCLAASLMLATTSGTSAHPLGNTSVNLYERVTIGAQGIEIHFVLDIAEFPALRETEFADTNDDGTVDDAEAATYLDGFWNYLEPHLQLTVGGQLLQLQRVDQELSFPVGQGGLQLMRAVIDLQATQPASEAGTEVSAVLTETAFEGVPGWHEMVIGAGPGVTLIQSSVPDSDVTSELTIYPPEMLDTPLSVREATFIYRVDQPSASPSAGSAPPATPGPGPTDPGTGPRPTDPMVALLGGRLDALSTFLGLLAAAVLGAVHALTPGHGKTLVAAYLVGTRSNVRHGLWLGGTVAVTHTAGIFILGLATLAFTELVIPEKVVGWLSVATGLLIVGLGAVFVWRAQLLRMAMTTRPSRSRKSGGSSRQASNDGHRHDSASQHNHDHDHELTPDLRRRDVAVLGIVGGLVPSGSALILLLSSIALNEVLYGLLLIVAFGLGMAAVLIGISTGIVLLRRSPIMGWERWRDPRLRPAAMWLPTISGLIVVALGLYLTLDALRNLR